MVKTPDITVNTCMNSKHTGRQDLALAYHATEDFANTLKPALHFMTFPCHSLHFCRWIVMQGHNLQDYGQNPVEIISQSASSEKFAEPNSAGNFLFATAAPGYCALS